MCIPPSRKKILPNFHVICYFSSVHRTQVILLDEEKKVTINLVTELRLEVFILSFLISKDSKP